MVNQAYAGQAEELDSKRIEIENERQKLQLETKKLALLRDKEKTLQRQAEQLQTIQADTTTRMTAKTESGFTQSPTAVGRKKAAHHYLKKKESVRVEDKASTDIMQMGDTDLSVSVRGSTEYKQPIQTYNKATKFNPTPATSSSPVGTKIGLRKKTSE